MAAGAPEAQEGGTQVGIMSSTTVKVNGVEVASDDSKPTVININLNQPSALASLLSAWNAPKTAPEGAKVPTKDGAKVPTKDGAKAPAFRGEQNVLGAIQIILGLVCIAFAVVFCFFRRNHIFYTGSGFWTGVPFVVAGIVSVVGGNRGSKCWLAIAMLFNWAVVIVAIAGNLMIAYDFMYGPFYRGTPDHLCDQQSYDSHRGNYQPDRTRNYRIEECKDAVYRMMCVFNGVRIMLLVVTSLALCIALYSLGYGCRSLCCNSSTDQEEEAITVTNDAEQCSTSQSLLYPEKPKMETI